MNSVGCSYNELGWKDALDSLRGTDDDGDEKKKKQSYTWEELNELERKRRKILRRIELPFHKILTYFDGTCLKVLAEDWLLWLTLGIYVFIRIQVRTPWIPLTVTDFGNTDIGILGGFLSFFLVLFVNQTQTRFNAMYQFSMNCEQSIFDIASIVVTVLPKADAARIIRYMNAAHAAGYVGLSKTYTQRAFFDELNNRLTFLTPKEYARVVALDMDTGGGNCLHEITTWCMKEITLAQKKDLFDGRLAGMLREKLLSFRANMDSIFDYSDQPVHFYYIHFLSLLSALYLPLFAASSAYSAGTADDLHWSTDLIAGLIVLVQAVFVIGLRLLGQQMVDPYGDDLEDLSVLYYVRSAWQTSNRILATHFPDDLDATVEDELGRTKAQLGRPWDADWKHDDNENRIAEMV